MMPPPGLPRPSRQAADALVSFLTTDLDRAAVARPNPGRPLLHRLNRAEYANAIRDLLSLEVDVTSMLPPDDSSAGFDNNADVLGVSPVLMERYLSAAMVLSAMAVGDTEVPPAETTFRPRADTVQANHLDGLPLGTRGGIVIRNTFPVDAEYIIKPTLWRNNAGRLRGMEHPHQLEILVDGRRVHTATIGTPEDFKITFDDRANTAMMPELDRRLQVRVPITAGPHVIGVTFAGEDCGAGAAQAAPIPEPGRRRRHLRHPEGGHRDDRRAVQRHRARRHAQPARDFHLCAVGRRRARADRDGGSAAGAVVRQDHHDQAGAARLSPDAHRSRHQDVDDVLRGRTPGWHLRHRHPAGAHASADEHRVRVPDRAGPGGRAGRASGERRRAGVAAVVLPLEQRPRRRAAAWWRSRAACVSRRCWRSRRGACSRIHAPQALVANFASQWLYLRNLRNVAPFVDEFPDFDDDLRQSFRRETEMLFDSIMRERSAGDGAADGRLHVRQRAAGQALRHSATSTALISAACR